MGRSKRRNRAAARQQELPRPQLPFETGGVKLREERRRLVDAVDVVRRADRYLRETVARCRAEGMSWAEVGRLVGMTGEGARKRFGAQEPVA